MSEPKFNRLSLAPSERVGRAESRRLKLSRRRFLDIQVDGQSLRSLIPEFGGAITPLCREWSSESIDSAVASLQGDARALEPGLAKGEAAILVCEECGDLDCGAIIANIDVSERVVTWHGFRRVQAGPPDDAPVTIQGAPFIFRRAAYMQVLSDAAGQLRQLK